MTNIQQLKAEAYDLLVDLQNIQEALQAKNQEIANALAQPMSNGSVAEPVPTGS